VKIHVVETYVMWYYFFAKNNQKGHRFTTKIMIAQNEDIIQAIGEKVYNEIPIVQDASDGAMYILIKDLPEKTANYIQGEMDEGMELPVLTEDYEKMVVAGWRSRGFICTYCRQSIEYMKHDALIKYLHVINPETGVSIFLIPWFMLPRKKYPVQVYACTALYSTIAGEPAGAIETAEVVKRLFGLETFDPSTVYRTKAQMSRLFWEHAENDGAISNQEPKIASTESIINWATEALEMRPSDKSIKNADWMKATVFGTQPKPDPKEDGGQTSETQESDEKTVDSDGNKGNENTAPGERVAHCTDEDSVCRRILGNITRTLADVRKPKPRVKHERRHRAPRVRAPRLRATHKKIDFVGKPQLERILNDFIRDCKNIVFNAALQYHKLLN